MKLPPTPPPPSFDSLDRIGRRRRRFRIAAGAATVVTAAVGAMITVRLERDWSTDTSMQTTVAVTSPVQPVAPEIKVLVSVCERTPVFAAVPKRPGEYALIGYRDHAYEMPIDWNALPPSLQSVAAETYEQTTVVNYF